MRSRCNFLFKGWISRFSGGLYVGVECERVVSYGRVGKL